MSSSVHFAGHVMHCDIGLLLSRGRIAFSLRKVSFYQLAMCRECWFYEEGVCLANLHKDVV